MPEEALIRKVTSDGVVIYPRTVDRAVVVTSLRQKLSDVIPNMISTQKTTQSIANKAYGQAEVNKAEINLIKTYDLNNRTSRLEALMQSVPTDKITNELIDEIINRTISQ